MGIKFKQVDALQSTFDALSGNLQGQITPLSGSVVDIASGTFEFGGNKFFTGNADFSGSQGIYVNPSNIYTPNTVFGGKLKIGGTISSPRTSTVAPNGIFQVTGGLSYFDASVYLRNNAGLSVSNVTGQTGQFYKTTGNFANHVSGNFERIGTSGLFVNEAGGTTGFVKFENLPTHTTTGDIPGVESGYMFRSGNHLMII